MKLLALEDLNKMSSEEIKDHLINNYAGQVSGFNYDSIKESDKKEAYELLKDKEVLVAYESVGSCGCDSSSFFVFKDKEGIFYELHGGHCSCYGFEGQLKDIEITTIEAIKNRAKLGYLFYCGGYDENSESNTKSIREFILSL